MRMGRTGRFFAFERVWGAGSRQAGELRAGNAVLVGTKRRRLTMAEEGRELSGEACDASGTQCR